MSKRDDHIISSLQRRLKNISREVDVMIGNIDFLHKEADPEAYRRWYLSHQSVRNLEGYISEALTRLDTYYAYKNLPWWKRIFKRG